MGARKRNVKNTPKNDNKPPTTLSNEEPKAPSKFRYLAIGMDS